MLDCDGLCHGCKRPRAALGRLRLSKAARRRGWRQEALSELVDLGELYGVDPAAIRGVG
ncbi:hypothetical protein [Streptomyces eurocidicus]|uniref:Uncharacterized protein n=1 Tax=Streptomyces eurocidicus TaxID=66423 RepID=A0A7W8F5V9_STREU|nr:hypothetical protein [Streptomyces eurocidicus]MBB5123212.1 hypothetical protein [Streptomyces eurocidicus]MBF6055485.1 hypothetical protein [Streptomyces eurocidicus]